MSLISSNEISIQSFTPCSTSPIRGTAVAEFRGEILNDVEIFTLPKSNKTALVARQIFEDNQEEYRALEDNDYYLYVSTKELETQHENKLRKRDLIISYLFDDIEHPGDINARKTEHEAIALAHSRLLRELEENEKTKIIKQKGLTFGGRAISLIAIKGEEENSLEKLNLFSIPFSYQ